MTFQSKYLGMSPFNCPSLFSILSFLEYEYGVFHPLGGCGAVSPVMARAAQDLGCHDLSRRRRPGDSLQRPPRRGRAIAIWCSQGRCAGDQRRLCSCHDPARARPSPPPLERSEDRRKKFSCSTFMLYLGIEGRYDDLAHHTIYLAERLPGESRGHRDRAMFFPEDPSFYVQNACVTDPSLAPPGRARFTSCCP